MAGKKKLMWRFPKEDMAWRESRMSSDRQAHYFELLEPFEVMTISDGANYTYEYKVEYDG